LLIIYLCIQNKTCGIKKRNLILPVFNTCWTILLWNFSISQ